MYDDDRLGEEPPACPTQVFISDFEDEFDSTEEDFIFGALSDEEGWSKDEDCEMEEDG